MLNCALRDGLENERLAHDLVDLACDAAGLQGDIGDVHRAMCHHNINVIFRRCESPVERLLFGGMALLSINDEGHPPVVFPDVGTLAELATLKQCVREFYELHGHYRDLTGQGDLTEQGDWYKFLDFTEVLRPTTTSEKYLMFEYTVCKFQDAPHIGLQIDLVAGVRVDGLAVRLLDDDMRLVLEANGWAWHGGRASFSRDRQRDRYVLAAGHSTIRISGDDLWHDTADAVVEVLYYHLGYQIQPILMKIKIPPVR